MPSSSLCSPTNQGIVSLYFNKTGSRTRTWNGVPQFFLFHSSSVKGNFVIQFSVLNASWQQKILGKYFFPPNLPACYLWVKKSAGREGANEKRFVSLFKTLIIKKAGYLKSNLIKIIKKLIKI